MVASTDKVDLHKKQPPQANEAFLLNTTFSVSHDSFLLPRQTCSPALMPVHTGVDAMDWTIHHEKNPEKWVYMYINGATDHGWPKYANDTSGHGSKDRKKETFSKRIRKKKSKLK